jgi:hypothetical protein
VHLADEPLHDAAAEALSGRRWLLQVGRELRTESWGAIGLAPPVIRFSI